MLDNHKQPEVYQNNYVYEYISESSLSSVEKLKSASSDQMLSSTSAIQQTFKYWNPATTEDQTAITQQQMETADQIGESSEFMLQHFFHHNNLQI